MVLFPTPPFALDTARTFPTPAILLFFGARGQCGGVPDLGRPYFLLEPSLADKETAPSQQGNMERRAHYGLTRGFSCRRTRDRRKSRRIVARMVTFKLWRT